MLLIILRIIIIVVIIATRIIITATTAAIFIPDVTAIRTIISGYSTKQHQDKTYMLVTQFYLSLQLYIVNLISATADLELLARYKPAAKDLLVCIPMHCSQYIYSFIAYNEINR